MQICFAKKTSSLIQVAKCSDTYLAFSEKTRSYWFGMPEEWGVQPEGFSYPLHSDTNCHEMFTEARCMQISLAALSAHDLNYL